MLLLAGLHAAAQPPAAPPEVPASTQPAAAAQVPAQRPAGGALLLNIDKNRDYSRVGLDYSLRWDFKDLASLRPGPGLLLDGVKAIASWDITKNTRVNYYGLRTNPWRLILSDGRKAGAGGGNGDGAAAGAAANEQARKRRLRLSLSPLAEDLQVSFNENLRDMILKASIRDPQWQKAGKDARRAVVQDVLSLGIWDAPLPVVRESRAGLEYLGK